MVVKKNEKKIKVYCAWTFQRCGTWETAIFYIDTILKSIPPNPKIIVVRGLTQLPIHKILSVFITSMRTHTHAHSICKLIRRITRAGARTYSIPDLFFFSSENPKVRFETLHVRTSSKTHRSNRPIWNQIKRELWNYLKVICLMCVCTGYFGNFFVICTSECEIFIKNKSHM